MHGQHDLGRLAAVQGPDRQQVDEPPEQVDLEQVPVDPEGRFRRQLAHGSEEGFRVTPESEELLEDREVLAAP